MAYTDNTNESVACLCAFISTFTEAQKNQLKLLVQNLSTLIDAIEISYKLVNQFVNYEDTLRLAGYRALEQIYSTTVQFVRIPVAFLFAATKNFADCPPVANISTVTKDIQDFIFSDVEDLKFKIQLYVEAMNSADNTIRKLARAREVLSDLADAIDACNLEQLKTAVV